MHFVFAMGIMSSFTCRKEAKSWQNWWLSWHPGYRVVTNVSWQLTQPLLISKQGLLSPKRNQDIWQVVEVEQTNCASCVYRKKTQWIYIEVAILWPDIQLSGNFLGCYPATSDSNILMHSLHFSFPCLRPWSLLFLKIAADYRLSLPSQE